MKIRKKQFGKQGLVLLAALLLLTTLSCQSSKKIIAEESLTGIYSVRESGVFNKTYTFASYEVSDIKASKPTKSVIRLDEVSQETNKQGLSFTMSDDRGFNWKGIGVVEVEKVTDKKNQKRMSNLEYIFRLTEGNTGRLIRIELDFNPRAADFDGFMTGQVVDNENKVVYEIYSSQNLNFFADPADGINGFSIQKGDTTLASILENNDVWSITYNISEDDPERVELSAVLASLFVMIKEGKIQ